MNKSTKEPAKEPAKDPSKEYKWDKKSSTYVPKASPLAYTLFIVERKEVLMKENKDLEEGKKLSSKQLSRKIRSEWKHMPDEHKKKYLEIVEKERIRCDAQMLEMESKGFFTLTTGVKSTDIKPPEETTMKRRSTTPMKPEAKKGNSKKKTNN